ncbi:MAG: class I SAM-dependent methyltransferase [Nitrospirae bacterium]|nr:class I SAM-dependent methyltransferase [Nitrospirota bacterium]
MKDLIPPFLEVGVGTGRFAKALGIRYGVDPSETMIEISGQRGITVEKAFGEDLPFRDNIFGGVFILFTLCFVARPDAVVSEAARVLKSGGGVIIGIINRESPWGQCYLQKKMQNHPIYKYANFYSIDEVEKMIRMTGMRIEGYSSTLFQTPSDSPIQEAAHNRLIAEAGFLCLLARKADNQDDNDH